MICEAKERIRANVSLSLSVVSQLKDDGCLTARSLLLFCMGRVAEQLSKRRVHSSNSSLGSWRFVGNCIRTFDEFYYKCICGWLIVEKQ